MQLATLRAFEKTMRKSFPGFRVSYKGHSFLIRLIAFFAKPINPKFMTRYPMTIGNTVYFPSQAYYEGQPKASFTLLAHELVHMLDKKRYGIWYHLSYFFPQIFAPFMLALFVLRVTNYAWPLALLFGGFIMGCWAAELSQAAFWIVMGAAFAATTTLLISLTHWNATLFFASLLLAAPWPAPWRAKWERRAYVMNLAVLAWTIGPPPSLIRDLTVKHFTSSEYYFMSWSDKPLQDFFDRHIIRANEGSLQKEAVYAGAFEFLVQHDQLRPQLRKPT